MSGMTRSPEIEEDETFHEAVEASDDNVSSHKIEPRRDNLSPKTRPSEIADLKCQLQDLVVRIVDASPVLREQLTQEKLVLIRNLKCLEEAERRRNRAVMRVRTSYDVPALPPDPISLPKKVRRRGNPKVETAAAKERRLEAEEGWEKEDLWDTETVPKAKRTRKRKIPLENEEQCGEAKDDEFWGEYPEGREAKKGRRSKDKKQTGKQKMPKDKNLSLYERFRMEAKLGLMPADFSTEEPR